jgi:hypothetical protein
MTTSTLREAVERHGSAAAAARALGIPRTTFRRRLAAEEHPTLEQTAAAEGFDAAGVTAYWHKSKRISAYVRVDRGRDETGLDRALERVQAALAAPQQGPPPARVNDVLSVLSFPDWHLLMQAHAEETGGEYDLSIAEANFRVGAARLLERAGPGEECLVLGLGDQFHTNSNKNVTEASGHPLQVSGRIWRAFDIAVYAFVYAVRAALRTHRRVVVRILPGNHDEFLATLLERAVGLAFAAESRVTVAASPRYYFAHQFGRAMVAATQGNNIKGGENGRIRAAAILAHHYREMYGTSDVRYLLSGDKHHERTFDVPGWLAIQLRAMTAMDAWAAKSYLSVGEVSLLQIGRSGARLAHLFEPLPALGERRDEPDQLSLAL